MNKKDKNLQDWADFYRLAYERKHKENSVLAGKLSDAETKEEELNFKLSRILNNPCYKITIPVQRILGMGGVKNANNGCDITPQNEEKSLNDVKSSSQNLNVSGKHELFIDGFTRIDIPEYDVVIMVCGKGYLKSTTAEEIKSYFSTHSGCNILYMDEDYAIYEEMDPQSPINSYFVPWLKPKYSPETLLSFNYFGHIIAVKSELVDNLPKIRGELSSEKFYDLCLKLEEEAMYEGIEHLNRILFTNLTPFDDDIREGREIPFSQIDAYMIYGAGPEGVKARKAAISRRSFDAKLIGGPNPDVYHVLYEQYSPSVSIIIPSKDNTDVLFRCINSIVFGTDYDNYEIVVVDNGSSDENKESITSFLDDLFRKYMVRTNYIYEKADFNFSHMCNLGASAATGEILLFLNDDIEVVQKDYLTIMVSQIQRKGIGAVGAKLYFAGTEIIQHVGVTNMAIGPSHKLTTLPDNRDYGHGRNTVAYNCIAVTAACLMIKKDVFASVLGFDEELPVSYNDVELCFKLVEAGYRNVVRNDAVLYHHESLSRGSDKDNPTKWKRLLGEKDILYRKHPLLKGRDPYYSHMYAQDELDYVPDTKPECDKPLKTCGVTKITAHYFKTATVTDKLNQSLIKQSIECFGPQLKQELDEPDIYLVSGWAFPVGGDVSSMIRKIILIKEVNEGEHKTMYVSSPLFKERRDVCEVFPDEKGAEKSGFVFRVKLDDIEPGKYKVALYFAPAQKDKGKPQMYVLGQVLNTYSAVQ